MKTRGFVVTNWNLDTDYQKLIDSKQVEYVAYGLETCPTTGKQHHQAFCYFRNQKSTGKRALCNIGQMFGETHCNVEPMKGSFAQNEAYCSKEGQLQEFGAKPSQGARGDLRDNVDKVLSGELTPDQICEQDPAHFHQYGRTLERAQTIHLRKKFRCKMTEGIWIWGPSGSGKSHEAFKDFDPDTHYVKNLNEEWWDGYQGQPIVILNEFRGQIRFSELLDLVDKWPKQVKWRCRESVPFLATKVIITSVKCPKDVFAGLSDEEPWEQFDRRFKIKRLEHRSEFAQK